MLRGDRTALVRHQPVRGVPLVGRRGLTKLLYAPSKPAADEREAVAQFLSVRLCRRPSRSQCHKVDGRDCLMLCCLAQPTELVLPGALRVGLAKRDERQCGRHASWPFETQPDICMQSLLHASSRAFLRTLSRGSLRACAYAQARVRS